MTTSASPPWLRATEADFERCFDGGSPKAFFEELTASVRQHFMLTGAFLALGATVTTFNTTLRSNAPTEINVAEHGLPPEAILLDINVTSGGELMPVEVRTNSSQQHLSKRGVLCFYGVRPATSDAVEGLVGIAITWLPPPTDEVPLRHLIDAVTSYSEAVARETMGLDAAGHFERLVVPANIAAETSLGRALSEAISSFATKTHAEEFLSNGATYSHQLHVLLPMIGHMTSAPLLDAKIVGVLVRLRNYRNKIAHRGHVKAPITRADAAGLLVAAIFAYHYARMLIRSVATARASGGLPLPTA